MITKSKAQELALYFHLPQAEIMRRYQRIESSPSRIRWVANSVKEWQSKNVNQRSKEQIEAWFRETANNIFELVENHCTPARKRLSKKVLAICKERNLKRILDYGGGVGEDSINAARLGFDATLADLPSKTLDFAKWRIEREKLPVQVIALHGNESLRKDYDAIICFEVFQHLYSPLVVARHFYRHLSQNGLLFVTTRFNNPNYPVALKKNVRFEGKFDRELQKIGFRLVNKIYQWGEGPTTKHLYVYGKKPGSED